LSKTAVTGEVTAVFCLSVHIVSNPYNVAKPSAVRYVKNGRFSYNPSHVHFCIAPEHLALVVMALAVQPRARLSSGHFSAGRFSHQSDYAVAAGWRAGDAGMGREKTVISRHTSPIPNLATEESFAAIPAFWWINFLSNC